MKVLRHRYLALGLFALAVAALACSLPSFGAQTNGDEATEPPAPPASEAPAPTDTPAPGETPEPTSTVSHTDFPASPGTIGSFMTDRTSEDLAAERRANADNFEINLLERPFTSEVMDYQNYLDIVRAEMSVAAPWVYITIFLEGNPPNDKTVSYGVEIDLDIDGRGDWLIYGLVPPSTDWTTDGVRAYSDSDNDVGSAKPVRVDAPSPGLNGYDQMVFDAGQGQDPDAAWIRRDPSNPDRVQVAFKYLLIGSDGEFMWGAWADEGMQNAAFFDYQDHFTIQEAGSPASNSSEYPLKALASVDNTCRWGYGFIPNGSEPGVCYVPPTPTPTPRPGSISGGVWYDVNGTGIREGGEGGLSGITVNLGQGACNSSGYSSTSTGGDGSFSFGNIPAGTYCVSIDYSSSCGWYYATTPDMQTVILNPGENKAISWFGLGPVLCSSGQPVALVRGVQALWRPPGLAFL